MNIRKPDGEVLWPCWPSAGASLSWCTPTHRHTHIHTRDQQRQELRSALRQRNARRGRRAHAQRTISSSSSITKKDTAPQNIWKWKSANGCIMLCCVRSSTSALRRRRHSGLHVEVFAAHYADLYAIYISTQFLRVTSFQGFCAAGRMYVCVRSVASYMRYIE